MIKFPCKCGHVFNLLDELAGGLIQCPRCGLLNDAPSLSEIPFISDDGTFKLEEPAQISDGIELADLEEAFSPHTTDSHGHQKDLRNAPDSYRRVGVTAADDPPRVAPKYDPSTGELIRPLALSDETPRPVLPIDSPGAPDDAAPRPVIPVTPTAAPRSIGYAVGEARKQLSPASLLIELLMPANTIVLFFVFLFYIFTGIIAFFLAVGGLYFQISLQVLNVPLWLIIAHYGCVIEDTGPDNRDEIPRPLRHFSISEDLWNPFFNVTLALVICFFPVMLAANPNYDLGTSRVPLMLLLELIGSFFFPAVVLTTVTGISLLNLRPDRVISVIRKCGGDYVLSVGIFLLSTLPTVFYLVTPKILGARPTGVVLQHVGKPYVMLPVLAIAVYLTHFFCWHLGLMYRAHHDEFPWLMQRHVKKPSSAFEVIPPNRTGKTRRQNAEPPR